MAVGAGAEELLERVRAAGTLGVGERVVAMLSGGQDSVCLLDVAVEICGAEAVAALHVNYGLRSAAGEEQRRCGVLCEQLGVRLHVVGADWDGTGNLQAWARDVRYGAARELARRSGALVASGHTGSDQAETVLYRLAASPGRRALLGMAAREGDVVRPLLVATRAETAAYCEARGLSWSEDESNASGRYARNRVRAGLLPLLREIHPAAERNVLRTAELLRGETELLEDLVDAELAGAETITLARLGEMQRALARLVVVRLAERARGGLVPQAGDYVDELLELGARRRAAQLHVGGGVGAVLEGGVVRMVQLGQAERRGAAGGGGAGGVRRGAAGGGGAGGVRRGAAGGGGAGAGRD
ncbi:MAG: tRNA lysidine(34) synthetase TilS [Solirubrobacteraceae bacterium]